MLNTVLHIEHGQNHANTFYILTKDVVSFAIAVRALTEIVEFRMPKKSLCSQTLLDHLPGGETVSVRYARD